MYKSGAEFCQAMGFKVLYEVEEKEEGEVIASPPIVLQLGLLLLFLLQIALKILCRPIIPDSIYFAEDADNYKFYPPVLI